MTNNEARTLSSLFPEHGHVLLSGTGKDLVERLGIDVVRRIVLAILQGENVRTQTEPLSRRRISQISGALVTMFFEGCLLQADFPQRLTDLALQQIDSKHKKTKGDAWLAKWIIGLTGKAEQNVLRGDAQARAAYLADFETALVEAAAQCQAAMGDVEMVLQKENATGHQQVTLDWYGILRLTTVIGCQTLAIRGSDKAIFGKLFERLVLGSLLTLLGFTRVNPATNTRTHNVFWLSDSSDIRESDATILIRPGKLARFDMGFIGIGNSEISKDKLSRYAREVEGTYGTQNYVNFIVVDRLPAAGTAQTHALTLGAEIIQMSMSHWPQTLAQRLGARLGFEHELQALPADQIKAYLEQRLATMPISDFLAGVSTEDLADTFQNKAALT